MTRLLYCWILRCHPSAFRRKYAQEMLWIFDREEGVTTRAWLLADALLSVGRQRICRPMDRDESQAPSAIAASSADGTPTFRIIKAGRPGANALLNGAIASVVAFGALALVMASGGGPTGFRKAANGDRSIAKRAAPARVEELQRRRPAKPEEQTGAGSCISKRLTGKFGRG